MTAQDLMNQFNDEFGLGEWPDTYNVDHETYANCCQFIFESLVNELGRYSSFNRYIISLDIKNNGLMLKNVELILQRNE